MKDNKVILYYRRPKKIEENAVLMSKDYTYFSSPLSSAIDGALRLALDYYAVKVVMNDVVVIDWPENYIAENYNI